MQHHTFHYKTRDDLQRELEALGVSLPLSDNLQVLREPLQIEGRTLANRLAVQPMEGCDATPDGSPGELTYRRYRRFAQGGAGMIWMEAVAVSQESRANPRQLFLHNGNVDDFARLVEDIKKTGRQANGFEPMVIVQATHSGRYSKPEGTPRPLIAYQNPIFEGDKPLDPSCILPDDALMRLEEQFGQMARLAEQAGFDGIDIKCCHRYLLNEFLSAYRRPGLYGGSFENRTRLLRNSVASAQAEVSSRCFVTCRLNIYDGFPYPYGYGVGTDGSVQPQLEEPIDLVGILHKQMGMNLINMTLGNPYVNPHVNRPYDRGPYEPQEHPLEGVARMFSCIGRVSAPYPDLTVVSSGHSYLRHLSPLAAAGVVEDKIASVAGFGREALAYPDFANDILHTGGLDAKKCCVSCGKCSQLMRMNQVAGCAVRDAFYLDLFRKASAKKEEAK